MDAGVTALLVKWREGDSAALDALIPIVYADLRRIARARLRGEPPGHPLQTTALVHEVYLRLVDVDRLSFENRAHFFALAARLMRQILVDHARRRRASKRGGADTILTLAEASPAVSPNVVDVIALDTALDGLAHVDERLSRVVELKFFAGLTIDEMAAALDVSPATVERDWVFAKAWLFEHLSRGS
jgi:RNA polymerase sigma factor (TIGR02999 family)